MITHSSSIGAGPPEGPDPRRARAAAPSRVPETAVDRISTSRAEQLREAIAGSPAVRPEKVARAEALSVDPNYPPLQIIERVARLIAESQDLSEVDD